MPMPTAVISPAMEPASCRCRFEIRMRCVADIVNFLYCTSTLKPGFDMNFGISPCRLHHGNIDVAADRAAERQRRRLIGPLAHVRQDDALDPLAAVVRPLLPDPRGLRLGDVALGQALDLLCGRLAAATASAARRMLLATALVAIRFWMSVSGASRLAMNALSLAQVSARSNFEFGR
jgi:hypothetical protein